MAEPILDRPRVVAGVGERVAAAMAEHVDVTGRCVRAKTKAKSGRKPSPGIAVNEHYVGYGEIVYQQARRLVCEGIVSKRLGSATNGRIVAAEMSKILGQKVVVKTKAALAPISAARTSHTPIPTATRSCSVRPRWRRTARSTAHSTTARRRIWHRCRW
jgi:hypothetical protein